MLSHPNTYRTVKYRYAIFCTGVQGLLKNTMIYWYSGILLHPTVQSCGTICVGCVVICVVASVTDWTSTYPVSSLSHLLELIFHCPAIRVKIAYLFLCLNSLWPKYGALFHNYIQWSHLPTKTVATAYYD